MIIYHQIINHVTGGEYTSKNEMTDEAGNIIKMYYEQMDAVVEAFQKVYHDKPIVDA